MKKGILLVATLFGLLTLAGCGGDPKTDSPTSISTQSNARTVDNVKSKFEQNGYTVQVQTIAGISGLIATKNADALTVLFFTSSSLASQQKPTYDASAGLVGYTCKQDGANLYYGTTSAIAVYDSLL